MKRDRQDLPTLSPELARFLSHGSLPPRRFGVPQIRCETVMVPMSDGVRLATDVYLPPGLPAPVIVTRTPYDRSREDRGFVGALMAFARRGWIVVSQDCRGTGDSEPDSWDYYMYEVQDGYDTVEWITKQPWYGGFIGSIGGSYVGQTQWCMAMHPKMSATVPSVSGLGVGINTAHLHMLVNAYARSVGKGAGKVTVPYNEMERLMHEETLATGLFNEPLHPPLNEVVLARYPELRGMPPFEARRWLWERYCAMTGAERARFVREAFGTDIVTIVEVEALSSLFGQRISHDRHTIPCTDTRALAQKILAPPLLRTGWYDWGLNDALDTFRLMREQGRPEVAARTRLLVTPYAHAAPGYREGWDQHPELLKLPGVMDQLGYTVRWFEAVRDGNVDAWPAVIYYLMGANEWRTASDWPVPEAEERKMYLGDGGTLGPDEPDTVKASDEYTYDPMDPTPTIGGSIVSFVYPTGSVDVSGAQKRQDVLVYTTPPLERDLDVVGPLRMVLYASSSAVDTDFVARLSDVFPDGRALQIQCQILRARFRDIEAEPQLLEPGKVYRLEVDMWATANRFRAGHRLRVDISSADFPKYDRNTNLGGNPGDPVKARQRVYRDRERASHLVMQVLGR